MSKGKGSKSGDNGDSPTGPLDKLSRFNDMVASIERLDPSRNIRAPLDRVERMTNPAGIRGLTPFSGAALGLGVTDAACRAAAISPVIDALGAVSSSFDRLNTLPGLWNVMDGWKSNVGAKTFNDLLGLAGQFDVSRMTRALMHSSENLASSVGFRNLVGVATQLDPLKAVRDAVGRCDSLGVSKALDDIMTLSGALGLGRTSGGVWTDPVAGGSPSPEAARRDDVGESAEDLDGQIVVNEDGTVCVGTVVLDRAEVENATREIADSVFSPKPISIDDLAERLSAGISAILNATQKKFLMDFLLGLILVLIAAVVNPPIASYEMKLLNAQVNGKSGAVQTEAFSLDVAVGSQPHLETAALRPVPVWAAPESKSATVGLLEHGQHVVLIDKHRHWSLVGWTDGATGVDRHGWVLSRYLAPPK